ncbi:hypothetical protein GCM10023346_32150 [Arthrobacter gyeryongensis]|uniref:Secreted protein n=1 Tax=Arthrobacter gyeryongensis TaxID=1650592 RepID=A0ABP9SLI7_9MICC
MCGVLIMDLVVELGIVVSITFVMGLQLVELVSVCDVEAVNSVIVQSIVVDGVRVQSVVLDGVRHEVVGVRHVVVLDVWLH